MRRRNYLRGVDDEGEVASVVLPDGLTRLKSVFIDDETTEFHLIINNTPDQLGSAARGDSDSQRLGPDVPCVHAEGMLSLPGAALDGTFDLEINEQFAVMVADASLLVEFGTSPFTVTVLMWTPSG